MKVLLVVAAIFLVGVASVVRCEEEITEVTQPQGENQVENVLDNETPVEEYEDEEDVEDAEDEDEDEAQEEDEDEDEEEESSDPAVVYHKVYKTVTYSKPVVKQVKVYSKVVTSSSKVVKTSSSSSSSKCVPSGYISGGCWTDKGGAGRAIPPMDKLLGGGDYQKRKDAIKKCYNLAAKKGLRIFAVQNGGWCAAGNSLSAAKKYGKSKLCKGGKGGPAANDVYIIKCAPRALPMYRYRSMGCWTDKGGKGRAIPPMDNLLGGGDYQKRKDAIKKCFNLAVKKGLKVFAVQNGGWCAAGNSLTAAKKYGKSKLCKGGKGGPGANDVYLIMRAQLRG